MGDNLLLDLLMGGVGVLAGSLQGKLFIALLLLLMFFSLFKRQIKGKLGEWLTSKALKDLCNDGCRIINDVTLRVDEDHTTQIDHIVVSPVGLFVIETKFFKGWIYGSERSSMWTQKIFKESYKFQNPFRQNYKHIKVLHSLFDEIDQAHFHSLIVMAGECEWRSKTKPERLFMSPSQAKRYIKEQLISRTDVFSEWDIMNIEKKLADLAEAKGLYTDIKHVKNLKKRLG